MAWPKRGTRKLHIDGENFLWHYDACCIWCSDDVFTIGQSEARYVLYLDPLSYLEHKPSSIVTAIRWALSNGWSPENGPNRGMALNNDTGEFVWLPDEARHLHDLTKNTDSSDEDSPKATH